MNHDFSIVFDTENELWQRVLDIYAKNDNYEKKVVKNRNLHHKFPKSFSKALGEEVDNDEDNLISLSLADHFLVHYYYYKLAKKGFRQSMSLAFRLMSRNGIKHITPDTAEAIAKDYEEACKNSPMEGKHHTKKSRRKISEARKGKHHSEEARRKMSEAKKGDKNPNHRKLMWWFGKKKYNIDMPEYIPDEELNTYRMLVHYLWNDIPEGNKSD